MKRIPFELPLPGKPAFSTKDRFLEMRSFSAEIWREENGIEDGALDRISKRKPMAVKIRVNTGLYR